MKRWRSALAAVAVVSLIGGFLAPHGPGDQVMWWDRMGVFYGLLGFVGCLAIIFISKALGEWLLQKREDYYDND